MKIVYLTNQFDLLKKEILDDLKKNYSSLEQVYLHGDDLNNINNTLSEGTIFLNDIVYIIDNPYFLFEKDSIATELFLKLAALPELNIIILFDTIVEASLLIPLKKSFNLMTKRYEKEVVHEYIKTYLFQNGVTIDPNAVSLFYDFLSENMLLLMSELQKITTYKDHLTTSDIQEIVSDVSNIRVYELTNAIMEQQFYLAYVRFQKLMRLQFSVEALVTILYNEFRKYLLVKEMIEKKYSYEAIIEALNVKALPLSKLNANAIKITTLKRMIQALNELEFQIKSGQIGHLMGIELFILNLSTIMS
ncbi:MAG: hypothetical protein LBR37_02020 [Erysipelotrichaceae bacterium]|jgi:DNA polymerase III delta subunit|nr:hypothetical protein [Erysipelotrichaceae bacterium]